MKKCSGLTAWGRISHSAFNLEGALASEAATANQNLEAEAKNKAAGAQLSESSKQKARPQKLQQNQTRGPKSGS